MPGPGPPVSVPARNRASTPIRRHCHAAVCLLCYSEKGAETKSMRSKTAVIILPITLALILSACGPGGGPSTSVAVTMTDFAFTPNSLMVPAGQEITIKVTNNGAVAHDLMIIKLGDELTSHDHVDSNAHSNAYWEQTQLAPGSTQESKFTAPTVPGEYQMICGVPGHLEAGMVGKL